jgi:hypothetical protein
MERRLQILLDEGRYARISAAAKQRGVSVATVIREAIDRYVVDAPAKRAAAGRAILAAEDMPVSDDLSAELAEIRERRSDDPARH